MYIVIVGGGRVGYYLCKALLDEGHEVLVLEKDPVLCEQINEEMGNISICGNGGETSTLAEAGASRAEMFIAVTNEDADNLIACQMAKHKFNVPRTVARINNPKNETIFKKLGIDYTVSATNVILEHIEQEVPTHPLIHLLALDSRGWEIVEVKVPASSAAVGRQIRELPLPPQCILSLVIREEAPPEVATADTILEAGDRIIAAISNQNEEALRTALAGNLNQASRKTNTVKG